MKNLLTVLLLFAVYYTHAQTYVYTINSTQLMKEPSITSKTISIIEPKTRIQLISNHDSVWSQVQLSGLTGFVRTNSISTLNINLSQLEGLPYDSTTGKIALTEVIQIGGASKDELYLRAREWFVHTFNSADEVLQMEDKEGGKLIGKGFSQGMDFKAQLWYTISIQVKESRYKYEISDIYYLTPASEYVPEYKATIEAVFEKGITRRALEKRRAATATALNNMGALLKEYMNKKSLNKEDW